MTQEIKLKVAGSWLDLRNMVGFGPLSLNEQERNVLRFIQEWTTGKQSFDFQTSGSTSDPKIITLERSQLIASAQLTHHVLQLQPGWNALVCLDARFIAGAMMIVRSLVTGMNIVVQAPSANPLLDVSDRIDFASFVPYQINALIEQTPKKLDAIHTVIVGGAPLNEDVIEKLQDFKTNIYATYAATETISHVALQRINGKNRQDSFHVLPGIKASIDERGCLVLTAPHFGNIVTNDIVDLHDAKTFRWIGRYDDVINTGGIKVQAGKVEKIISEILQGWGIQNRLFVAGVKDSRFGEQVVLFIEGSLPLFADEEMLNKKIRERLSKYEVPKLVVTVPQFPETATQKVDKRAVIQSATSLNEMVESPRPPVTEGRRNSG